MHTLTQIPGTVPIPPLTQPLVSAKTETAAPAELEITMVITAQMHSQIMEIIRIMTQKIGGGYDYGSFVSTEMCCGCGGGT